MPPSLHQGSLQCHFEHQLGQPQVRQALGLAPSLHHRPAKPSGQVHESQNSGQPGSSHPPQAAGRLPFRHHSSLLHCHVVHHCGQHFMHGSGRASLLLHHSSLLHRHVSHHSGQGMLQHWTRRYSQVYRPVADAPCARVALLISSAVLFVSTVWVRVWPRAGAAARGGRIHERSLL